MGDKAKSSDKNKFRDKVPKVLKGGAGGKGKKKKWSKTKSKEKVNNAVFWTKPVWDKLLRDVVGKETYVTPSIISEKLKLNVSLAREAIRQLLADNQIAPTNGEYQYRFCNFVKTANFVAPIAEKKEEKKGKK